MPGNSQPSEGVKDILVEDGIGVFASESPNVWAIRISRMKDKPNKMICVYDTSGFPPEPGLDINYPGIQVVIRGEPDGYRDAWTKCARVRDSLLGRPSETRNGDIWASVTMTSDIVFTGYDDNERPTFSMNFLLIIHQGDLTNSHREPT